MRVREYEMDECAEMLNIIGTIPVYYRGKEHAMGKCEYRLYMFSMLAYGKLT